VPDSLALRRTTTAAKPYSESKQETVSELAPAASSSVPERRYAVSGTTVWDATDSVAPSVSAPSELPFVLGPMHGGGGNASTGEMSPDGRIADGRRVDRPDGELLIGTNYDLHASSTDNTGMEILYPGDTVSRRVEVFPAESRSYTPTNPAPGTAGGYTPLDPPDWRNRDKPGTGHARRDTAFTPIVNGSGSAYNAAPPPPATVNAPAPAGTGNAMPSWG
jgi:hypothetical protein